MEEVIVEKLVHTGITDEDIATLELRHQREKEELEREHEAERTRIFTEMNLTAQEMQENMEELDRKKHELEEERAKQQELIGQLRNMQGMIMKGSETMAVALEHEQNLYRANLELNERRREEMRIQTILQEQEEERERLQESYMTQDEQVQKLTGKLEKLFTKFKRSKQELQDVMAEHHCEKDDIFDSIREITREARLLDLILEEFVPPEEVESLKNCAVWNEETQDWSFEILSQDPNVRSLTWPWPPVRPKSSSAYPRPTSAFSRAEATRDANPRFRYDQIMPTDLDPPERCTQDWAEIAGLPEALMLAVCSAAGDESDDETDLDSSSDHGSSVTTYFPQARGLVQGWDSASRMVSSA